MNSTIKNIFKSVTFIAGLALLLVITSRVMVPKNNLKKAGFYDHRAHSILSEPANTIDVLFVGDSESFSAFCPPVIWDEQGITSYVCGTAAQRLYYTEEFVHKAFNTQKPKVVILETNAIFREFEYTDSVKNKMEKYIPVFRYHNRWKKLKFSDFINKVRYVHIEHAKGYKYNGECVPASTEGYMEVTTEKKPVSKRNRGYVKAMAKFCEENNAKLILVSTPSTKNWNYRKHNSIKELSTELELEYIDMNLLSEELNIDWNTDTRDKGDHMNHRGAVKVSKYLGRYLADMKLFADKRDNPQYSNWNRDINKFKKSIKKLNKAKNSRKNRE